MKNLLALCTVLICSGYAVGQSPVIYSIDRPDAAVGDVVTLHGTDFGTNAANLKVFFGATEAQIRSVSNQLLEVYTPAGATFESIHVTNTTNGRTGYYSGQFLLRFGGQSGIDAASFAPQIDFQAQSGLYDLCICDLDSDGKPDIATASNDATAITVFRNTSTPGTISLVGQNIQLGSATLHVKCGDLNGDGRPDLVFTQGADGSRVFILTNNGGMSFSAQAVDLPGIKVKQIAIADLDLDGRPEIVVTNTGTNAIIILPNQSSVGSVTFGTPRSLAITGATFTDAIAVGDLNEDGYPEIVTSQYQLDSESKLFLLENQGGLSFSTPVTIPVDKAVSDIRLADFNADGVTDIVIARLTSSDVAVFPGTAGNNLAFGNASFFATEMRPVGVDIADFDGDGRPDLAVGSLAKSVSVLNNTSTGGAPAFAAAVKVPVTYVNRNLRNADLDGDGKPDIVFTSVDDNSGVPVPASKISVLRNLSCMVPEVTPGAPAEICTGATLRLNATQGGGTVYHWYREGQATPLKSGEEHFLDVTTAGTYSVVAEGVGTACSKTSNDVTVGVADPAAALTGPDANARSNSPACTHSTLTLQVDDVGATAYRWTGPDGFSQTVSTTTLDRPDFNTAWAGRYIVEMLSGTCVALVDTTMVEAITVPAFTINRSADGPFCAGDARTLTLQPAMPSGFTVQWHEDAQGPIPEANFASYQTSVAGEYYAVVTPPHAGCESYATESVTLTPLARPVADFEAPAEACAGSEVALTATATGDPGGVLTYQWNLGDGGSAASHAVTHSFDAADTYTVTLTVSYDGLPTCSDAIDKTITVRTAETPTIATSAAALCPDESADLQVEGNYATITWGTGASTSTITVDGPGTYTVETVDPDGCAAEAVIEIEAKPVPAITVSADRTAIVAGQEVALAAAGADHWLWSPEETLNDPTLQNPTATPEVTVTYTATGTLTDGCEATASITIQVSTEVPGITVPVLFSPNGDQQNEQLVIDGIENFPDCILQIYDRHGRKVYGALGYQNNWDGTINGTPVPEGVYFYVFSCPGDKSVTGSVTVIR